MTVITFNRLISANLAPLRMGVFPEPARERSPYLTLGLNQPVNLVIPMSVIGNTFSSYGSSHGSHRNITLIRSHLTAGRRSHPAPLMRSRRWRFFLIARL